MLDAVVTATFQNMQEAHHVAVYIGMRIGEGIAHSGLRSKVRYTIKMRLCKKLLKTRPIFESEPGKGKAWLAQQLVQSRLLQPDIIVVVEIIETHNLVATLQQALCEVKPDESRSACNK